MYYCDYGCGKEANYVLKNKKNCCSKGSSGCEVIKKKNSDGVRKSIDTGLRTPSTEIYKNLDEDTKNRMAWSRDKTILDLDDVFVVNSSRSSAYIKKIIIKEKLISYICDCGISDTWRNATLILELDHINGINNDNRLENLRFLCPNCHSQTDTFRGRNINTGKIKVSDELLLSALQETDNIRQALTFVGLAPKGGNYKRAEALLKK